MPSNLISLNVHGLNDDKKRRKMFCWFKEQGADFCFIQETHCKKSKASFFNSAWHGTCFHSFTTSAFSRGVAILIDKKVNYDLIDYHTDNEGRQILINISWNDSIFTLVCLYAPNDEKERVEFFKNSTNWILKHSKNTDQIIVAGDFNCCLNDNDRTSRTHLKDASRESMKSLIKQCNTVDVWQFLNGSDLDNSTSFNQDNLISSKDKFTWFDHFRSIASRLDYILSFNDNHFRPISMETKWVITSKVGKRLSDHKALILKIENKQELRGPGTWKLNTSHLKDKEYIELIKNTISKTLTSYNTLASKRMIWELLKIKIKEASIAFAIQKSRTKKSRALDLETKLKRSEKLLEKNPNDITLRSTHTRLEQEITQYYNERAEGIKIRARINWAEKGERSTKYFLGLENQRQKNNHIVSLLDDGKVVSGDIEVMKVMTKFYKELYSSQNISDECIKNYLMQLNIECKLNIQEQQLCDAEITENECLYVIKSMKCNKSPGSDGLPSEFYKQFWNEIKICFMANLREIFYEGELSNSMKRAIISLIFKKGDKLLLKNYRPISLTNTDYKIIAFVLSVRMQKVIPKVVSYDQTAYIKNRFIGTNIRLTLDIFDFVETFNLEGALLLLDFEKAFDTVEWSFMYKVLQKLGFGENYIRWITILYTKPEFVLKNNGWLSSSIKMSRGIRQGCPVSALLFVLVVEMMAIAIKTNKDIQGICVGEHEAKISQYADDTTIFLANMQSISTVLSAVHDFSNVAGPKLNVSKTEGIWLGKFKENNLNYMDVNWTNEPVRCLGVYIGHNKERCYNLNWTRRLQQIQNVLNSWRSRHLTIFGKITIVKILACSKIYFPALMLCIPEQFCNDVNKVLYSFIWNKNDRISRKSLIASSEDGGLNMIDIESKFKALKVSWVKRLYNGVTQNNTWTCVFQDSLNKMHLKCTNLFRMSFRNSKNCPNSIILPQFYKDVCLCFNQAKQSKPFELLSNRELMEEILWGNELFMSSNRTLLFQNWTQSDVIYVKDILDCNGEMLSISDIKAKLRNTRNYICEYLIIKQCVRKITNRRDCDNTALVMNLEQRPYVLGNKRIHVNDIETKYVYSIFIRKKYTKPFSIGAWAKCFNSEKALIPMKQFFRYKIIHIPDKKLAEFNYKLFSKILVCGYLISKWNKNIPSKCPHCQEIHTVEHMLYSCQNVLPIWKQLSKLLKVDISWYKIVFGYLSDHTTSTVICRVINIVAFAIYKHWIVRNETVYPRNVRFVIRQELALRGKIMIPNYDRLKYIIDNL